MAPHLYILQVRNFSFTVFKLKSEKKGDYIMDINCPNKCDFRHSSKPKKEKKFSRTQLMQTIKLL